ncbi:MAG: hypothetical protein SOV27_00965 [Eubacteriales bacterium]|nr:hypothetical protein [Eubacteriales bacterium]
MPKGYELTSFYDAQRAVQRKVYSREIKQLSGLIKDYGYLNNNLYGLIISAVNNGLEDNLGYLTQYMHGISKSDIGVNQSSRLQDFMSPLELRANAMAIRRAALNISRLGSRATINQIQQIAYDAGQSVGLEFQGLKITKNGQFSMQINSPVLSTTPIIKKYDKALLSGTVPKGESIKYTDFRQTEREDLILANKQMFAKVKDELTRLGMVDKSNRKTAFKMLNLAYYYIADPQASSMEMSTLLFAKEMYNKDMFHHTELGMNLQKLTLTYNALKNIPYASTNDIYSQMYRIGTKAREGVILGYKMLPEMFTGFYDMYAISEKQTVAKKQQLEDSRKAKKSNIKE